MEWLEKLSNKGIKTDCEACGGNNWTACENLMNSGIKSYSHIGYAIIHSLICNECGYMRLFAVIEPCAAPTPDLVAQRPSMVGCVAEQ